MSQKERSPKKKVRKKFISVDVWRSQFGPVSVRAIYEVYAQTFRVEIHNMKRYSLSQCINALRLKEDPDYEEPQDEIRE